MDMLYGGRRNGRTVMAVVTAAEHNWTLTVHSEASKQRCIDIAKELGLTIKPPILWKELFNASEDGQSN